VVDFSIALPQLLSGKNTALYTQLFTAYALTRSSRNAAVRGFLSGPRVQELLLRVGSGLRSECNVNWSGPLKIAFYRMNRSKRNETNQNPLPSIRLKSYRNETRRIERNRIEIGFCRFDIIEEILGSIRLLSIRFVSIDSRRSIQPSLLGGGTFWCRWFSTGHDDKGMVWTC